MLINTTPGRVRPLFKCVGVVFGVLFDDDCVNSGVDGGGWCVEEVGLVVGDAVVGPCVDGDFEVPQDCVVAGVGVVEAEVVDLVVVLFE